MNLVNPLVVVGHVTWTMTVSDNLFFGCSVPVWLFRVGSSVLVSLIDRSVALWLFDFDRLYAVCWLFDQLFGLLTTTKTYGRRQGTQGKGVRV